LKKEDIIRKLTSRKFWCAIIAWLTSLPTAWVLAESPYAQAMIIITGIGALVAYLFAEAKVDCQKGK